MTIQLSELKSYYETLYVRKLTNDVFKQPYYNELLSHTSFLQSSVTHFERIYCLLNDISQVPILKTYKNLQVDSLFDSGFIDEHLESFESMNLSSLLSLLSQTPALLPVYLTVVFCLGL